MIFADALFATQSVLEILNQYRWEYVIQFSKNKLKQFAELFNSEKKTAQIYSWTAMLPRKTSRILLVS